ncbi:MAG: M15 family metallopeptidase [Thermodesulfovibrionales bacterium]|nr:M15 family metallopeptidase [Thermodesulfovibrionales bacterium]
MRRDIDALHPVVRDRCARLIEACSARGLHLMVTSSLRSAQEQAALYAQGRKPVDVVNALRAVAGLAHISSDKNTIVTHATTSVHEFGLAFDVALTNDGAPHWDKSLDLNDNGYADYREVGSVGESLGLVWGGRFRHRDLCHFEWTGGLTMGELKAGKRPAQHVRGQTHIKEEKMDKVKSGVRSSEFYLAIIGALIPVLNTHLGFAIPVEGVLSIAGVIVSYIISRTVVKRV